MYYAKVTTPAHWGLPEESSYYGFRTRAKRNEFVRLVNEESDAHARYRAHDVWPGLWTKYDHAYAMTAAEFHKEMPRIGQQWQSDGDRWTWYIPCTLFWAPEVITA